MKQLTPEQIEARKEKPFDLTLESLWKGYSEIFYDNPIKMFQKLARKTETSMTPLMTGYAAAITMPLSIIGRNASRVIHDSSKGHYIHAAEAIGTVGAGTAWWLAGSAIYTKAVAAAGLAVGATATPAATTGTLAMVGAMVGKVGIGIGAIIASAPIVVPAFTTGVMLSSLLIGAGAAALSIIPAVNNLGVAFGRSLDRLKGIKYDEFELTRKIDEDSLQAAHARTELKSAIKQVDYLPLESQRIVYDRLKEQFDAMAKHTNTATTSANNNVASAPAASQSMKR